MSNEAQTYAARVRVGDITAKFVLSRLADRADERFSCFPSVPLLAAEAEKSERVIQRALALLRTLRLVSDKATARSDGSQGSNRYYLHGPWDNYAGTGVPFPEIVTPKQKRAQLWAERPAEGEFRPGTAAAVAVSGDREAAAALEAAAAAAAAEAEAAIEARREKARKARQAGDAKLTGISAVQYGVTSTSPPPTTSTSPPPTTSTSPLEPSGVTPNLNRLPSVRPSAQVGDAREAGEAAEAVVPSAPNGTDGRTDGEVEQQEIQETGVPVEMAEATTTAAPVASQGVELLMELGRREPQMALAGKVLTDQGALVDGLLAAGWTWSALISNLAAPLPEKISTSVAAIIAGRVRRIPACPPVQRDPALPLVGVPAPRTVEQELQNRSQHECQGRDGFCGRQVPVEGALCSACRKPCSAGCGRGPAEPARRDGLCRECVQDEVDATLPRCSDGCGRPAVRSDGRCAACHQEEAGRQVEEQEMEEARAALAVLLGTDPVGVPF